MTAIARLKSKVGEITMIEALEGQRPLAVVAPWVPIAMSRFG
jgi:hypothetical protein